MPYSLSKVEDLLASRGFIAKKYFTLDEYCIYIEAFSVSNANTFMLYISARYELKVPEKDNVFKLKYMEMNPDETIISNYAEEPDNVDIEKYYNDHDIELDTEKFSDDLEKKLKEHYNKPLLLKDLSKEDNKNLKDIFRQMSRFMFCVQNIKYKLSIVYKNYLVSITKDDELDCFLIYDYPKNIEQQLLIYIDLKTFVLKIETVSEDIIIIKDGIHRLLDQNQRKHSKLLSEMLEQRVSILQISMIVERKKEEFNLYIKEYEGLLLNINESERNTLDKIQETKKSYSEFSVKGFHHDVERSHLMAQYEKELVKINGIKQQIMENILAIRSKHENITLKMDRILFDNSIMINEISKNFAKLSEFVE